MSWASHNPELYDEITRKGIISFLEYALYRNGYEGMDPKDTIECLVTMFQEDSHFRKVYDELCDLANTKILDATRDHFSRLADAARDAYKDHKQGG